MRAYARAFTLMELLIVLSCASITVPLAFVMLRNVEADERAALARAEAATEMRGFSEEVRADLQTMRRVSDDALVLIGKGECTQVEYVLTGDVVFRRGAEQCGPPRPVAAGVQSMTTRPDGIEVVFGHRTTAEKVSETRFFLGAPR